MSSSSGGPSVSLAANPQPIMGVADSAGNFQLYGPGGAAIPTYNPSSVAIANGTIGGVQVRAMALIEKLRSRKPIDSLKQLVSIAPAAWSAKTYLKGEAVSNGGNWYVNTVPGDSTVAPTGTDAPLIADGATVKWQFLCIAPTLNTVDVPTIATATTRPVDLTTIKTIGTGNYPATFFDPTSLFSIDQFSTVNTYSGWKDGSFQINPNPVLEFMTDAPRFTIKVSFTESLRFIVDGVAVTAGNFPTANATGLSYTTLDFGGVRRDRKIQVLGPANMYDVSTTAVDTVWAVPDNTALRGMWVGDSWGAGSAMGPSRLCENWPSLTAKELGIGEAMINNSVGGTGWLTQASVYNYLQRLTAIAPYLATVSLDFVVLQGTGNDTSNSVAAVSAQYLAVMRQMRALQPNAVIFVTGQPTITNAALAATWNPVIVNAFNAWADPLSYFIPVQTDTQEGQAWFSDTRNTTTMIGLSDKHPLDSGLRMLSKRTAASIRRLLGV